MRRLALALLLVATPLPAQAHLVGMEFGDFYAGALHLLISPEHATILLALALVAAFQPVSEARWVLAALPAGFALGSLGGALLPAEIAAGVLGASLAVIGLLAALALRIGTVVVAGLTLAAAALHGFANMQPALGTAELWLYGAGAIAAGTVAGSVLTAVFSTFSARTSWMPIAYRVLAGWIVAIGTMYTGLSAVA